jgi:hypothetical protein
MNATQCKKVAVVVLVGIAIMSQMTLGGDEPNGVLPDDPLFPLQWHLHNTGQNGGTPGVDINAIKAWEITTGDPNIIIAIVGEGIDLDHPDLVNNLVAGTDFYDGDDSPYPSGVAGSQRETEAAGLIASEGNNGIGVAGVTWRCKIMPVRVAKATSYEWYYWQRQFEAAAYRWAAANGADIISMGRALGLPTAGVRAALIDITKPSGMGRNGRGCLFVTPSHRLPIAPGRFYYGVYPETISVDAVDPWDQLWWAHEAGSRVDLVAPTGCPPRWCDVSAIPMWTTDIAGPAGADGLDYTDEGGAQCSLVAGVAALMLSIEPNLTSDEVRHYLCRSAHDLGEPGRDDDYGWGRVDARAALDMVLAKRCDLNNDWKVDEQDVTLLNGYIETNDLSGDIALAAKRDGKLDEQDLELLMQYLGIEIPEFGLLAHWKLDESEGERAFCSEGIQAVLHGGPVWLPAEGMIGGALQFDGVDDYVSTAEVLDTSTGPFSFVAWVKGGVPGQVVLSQADGENWLCTDSAEGCLMTELKAQGQGTAGSLLSQTVITDGQWHHVGLVYDLDSLHRRLYVDGALVVEDTTIVSGVPSDGGLYIGAGKDLDAASFFSGLIDDIRIYSRAVSP